LGDIFLMLKNESKKIQKTQNIKKKILSATVCGSDLHTISGKRIESTPRFIYIVVAVVVIDFVVVVVDDVVVVVE